VPFVGLHSQGKVHLSFQSVPQGILEAQMNKLTRLLKLTRKGGDLFDLIRFGEMAKKWIVPRNIPAAEEDFMPSQKLAEQGIEYNLDRQLEMIQRWASEYRTYWPLLREDPKSIPSPMGRNTYITGTIRRLMPKSIAA
jgi:hypothetical protein